MRRRLGLGHFPRTTRRAVACREKKRQRCGGTWLFNEARAVGMVQHPGLVRVHDYQQTAAGNAYIVMEFLQGESLAARIEAAHQLGHGLPLPLTLHIGGQVAAALAAAHAAGVVHCDLKPDDVPIERDWCAIALQWCKVLTT